MTTTPARTTSPATPTRPARRAWWREPTMWLVVGAPAVSVVVGVGVAVVAIRTGDPVVAADAGRLPAMQGRNHAAAPPPVPR